MKMVYQVRHQTRYVYEEQIPLCHNEARVLPRQVPWQKVLSERLSLSPEPDDRRERTDYFGNRVLYYSVQRPHNESITVSEFEVEIRPDLRADPSQSMVSWMAWQERSVSGDGRPWTYASPRIPLLPQLAAYATEIFVPTAGLVDGCSALMSRIHSEFTFDPDSTQVTTSVAEAFARRRGVCQDFTHVMIASLRALGLPARYVSGYIETVPAPGQPKLEGADATHAWVSVLDPDAGWIDFDPTNNLMPSAQHITLGWGRDFSDIIPVKGVVIGGGDHTLEVSVNVTRIQ